MVEVFAEEPDRHEPKTTEPVVVDEKDDAETVIATIPFAKDYLKSLGIDASLELPKTVRERIKEKGVEGFGELVAPWVIREREKKAEAEESK